MPTVRHLSCRVSLRRGARRLRSTPEIGEFGPPPPPVPDIASDGKGAYDLADDGKPMWLKCDAFLHLPQP